MKRCGVCQTDKPLEEFHRRGAIHQSVCKQCRKGDDRSRYAADRDRHASIRDARRRELSLWAFELKRDKPCADCGVAFHPAAMQWDHTGQDKEFNVSAMARVGFSKARILREIAKCELVCANCHAVRTYERRTASGALTPTG